MRARVFNNNNYHHYYYYINGRTRVRTYVYAHACNIYSMNDSTINHHSNTPYHD